MIIKTTITTVRLTSYVAVNDMCPWVAQWLHVLLGSQVQVPRQGLVNFVFSKAPDSDIIRQCITAWNPNLIIGISTDDPFSEDESASDSNKAVFIHLHAHPCSSWDASLNTSRGWRAYKVKWRCCVRPVMCCLLTAQLVTHSTLASLSVEWKWWNWICQNSARRRHKDCDVTTRDRRESSGLTGCGVKGRVVRGCREGGGEEQTSTHWFTFALYHFGCYKLMVLFIKSLPF